MKTAQRLFILIAILLLLSASAFATQVSIPDQNANAGSPVNIPVNVDNALGIAGFQFTITYSTAVLNCSNAIAGSLTGGWTLLVNATVPGEIQVGGFNFTQELGAVPGSLTILQCTAQNPGSTPVAFTYSFLSNLNSEEIAHNTDPGVFTTNCVPTGPDTDCNGLDEDCDGTSDDGYVPTPTSCGIGACAATGQLICQSGSLVDTCTSGTPEIEGPYGTATCSDQMDNDCDGATDGADPNCALECTDNDHDGYKVQGGDCGPIDCDDSNPAIYPGAADSACDGVDNDCDGTPDDGYVPTPSTCGLGTCEAQGQWICQNGSTVNQCTPGTPGTEGPYGTQTCSDQLDNDCDGLTDGADPNCLPRQVVIPNTNGNKGAVVSIPINVTDATGIAGFQFTITYDPAVLNCFNAIAGSLTGGWNILSNPATGQIQVGGFTTSGFPGGTGSLTALQCNVLGNPGASTPVAFGSSMLFDENSAAVVATPVNGTFNVTGGCVPTGPDANCNGADEDCNGTPDDGYVPTPASCGVGACVAQGQLICTNGQTVNNCTPGTPSVTRDLTCDGVDNDCDAAVDEDYVPTPTSCGAGLCTAQGELVCQAGSIEDTCDPGIPQTEGPIGMATCSDQVDNDCDSAVDGDDDDCLPPPQGVSIPTMTAVPGSVEIPVNVGDATGIAGFQFTIAYNASVLDCNDATAGSLTGGWNVLSNPEPGQIQILGFTTSGLPGGTGSLAILQCNVIGNLGTSTPLNFASSLLSDENSEEIRSETTPGHVTVVSPFSVLSPNGGEVLPSGSTHTIRWSAPANAVEFKILWSKNNGKTWEKIANDVTGSSYDWTVPTVHKKKCRVKVVGFDASGVQIGKDISDKPFAIEMVKLISPDGGETLTSRSRHTISWKINGSTPETVSSVKMSYRCGTEKWKLINYYTPNLSYSWHVPAVTNTRTDCEVKVDLLNQALTPIASDKSDSKFTINPAP